MSDEGDLRVLFDEARALPKEQQEAFVRARTSSDVLVERVLALLRQDTETGFLERPAHLAYEALLRAAGQRIAEFEIVREIGRGGMGIVYEAKDTLLGRPVALKILATHLTGFEPGVARFRHEARVVAALQHPGIVQVYRYGETGSLHYIAMEFVDGQTLAQRMAHPPPDPQAGTAGRHREMARIVGQIAEALDYAHTQGVIHRDVKPSNILVDAKGQAKLTDFGIALLASAETMHTHGTLGTTYYMSPEQADASLAQIDHRTDVFSLGVVLYEGLCGQRPFEGDNNQQILRAICTQAAPPLRAQDSRIPRDLETVCQKALEKQPAGRYPTAAHLAGDLRCWQTGQPILARKPGVLRRVRRWAVAHRVKTLGIVVGFFALLSATLGWHVKTLHDDRVAWLSVATDLPGCEVFIRDVDSDTTEVAHDRRGLGLAPTGDFALLPGQYRVSIIESFGEAFAECDVSLLPGRQHGTAVRLLGESDGLHSGRMVESRPTAPDTSSAKSIYCRLAQSSEPAILGMVRIPAGEYEVGRADNDPDPLVRRRRVRIPEFLIDRSEVSNQEYKAFVDATGHRTPDPWIQFGYDARLADRPVIFITNADAEAYARWCGKRLPTAIEWEIAARYPDGRVLPWGSGVPPALPRPTVEGIARLRRADLELAYPEYCENTLSVRGLTGLATLHGLHHMVTNVSEMTSTISVNRGRSLVKRGAAWCDPPEYFDASYFWTMPPDAKSVSVGFRCARSTAP